MEFKIKPIKNQKDYNAALNYFETLLDYKEGSPEADMRDVLAILIEKYEDKHYKIDFPTPLAAIKFRMDQSNIKQKDLIPYIGSRSKVSEVLSGKRQLTLKMIRALNKHLGIPAEVLLSEEIPAEIKGINFNKFPLVEMEKNGAFKDFNTKDIEDKAEEAIRFLLDKIGGIKAVPAMLFRKKDKMRINAKLNHYALFGWCLQVLSEAKDENIKAKFNSKTINKRFLNGLVCLSSLEQGPKLAVEYLSNHGIILKIVPHLKHTYLDGASFITIEGRPVIGLTIRYDRIDNFWFVLLHEIGHIVRHLKKGNCYADDMTLRGSSDDIDIEIEADKYAEKTLLPENFNQEFGLYENRFISQFDIIEYAREKNIHTAIIAGRIQYERNDYRTFSNLVGRNEVKKCFPEVFKNKSPG